MMRPRAVALAVFLAGCARGGDRPASGPVVVDTTPLATQPVLDAVPIARPGGTIVLAGIKGRGRGVPGFPTDEIAMRYQTIRGVRTVDYRSYQHAVRLIESGRVPVERLHTHHFPLEQATEALKTLAGGASGDANGDRRAAISITLEP